MKLTQKQQTSLSDILQRMRQAEKFLEDDNVFLGHYLPDYDKTGHSNTFWGKDKKAVEPYTKFYGSELMQLKNAIFHLEAFINVNNK